LLPPTRKRNKRKKKKNQTTKDKRQVFPTKAGLQRGPLQLSREFSSCVYEPSPRSQTAFQVFEWTQLCAVEVSIGSGTFLTGLFGLQAVDPDFASLTLRSTDGEDRVDVRRKRRRHGVCIDQVRCGVE
jgi:hypothetical protein